ncbi:DUF185-domain-containing protein [Trametes versicolor FP-101664 SS1]|uniref:DUF185-domain-containing protein n=1 Tax=Trametes versicolor (strain FP-101664) TaxID=717944 RepID=UPI0004623D74|nr:DUF185-domain-containing protein [Trametes versicolor FP-101664 SS1]EIW57294.1 DUF185-domain-containing protein [Trametes versicolor FP-101664 SS1]
MDTLAASPRRHNACVTSAKSVLSQRRAYATGSEAPTEVEKILLDTIKATGPISFATYMQMCLAHPTAGYYMKTAKPVIGSGGDFITSPEISQVFGELLGIWLLSQWMYAGGGREIRLLELGPGRGTLMHDVLRVFSQFPAARSATKEIHLVETSQTMRSAQDAKLSFLAKTHGWQLHWHDAVDQVPHDSSKFTLVLAHEFFDALPFHLLQKTHHGWQEVLIASGPDAAAKTILRPGHNSPLDFGTKAPPLIAGARFRQVLSPSPTPSSTLLGLSSARFQKLPVGSRIEVSPASFKIARQVGELLRDGESEETRSAGSALIIDYGGEKVYGNSFRAFKDHKIVDAFHRPGECDLTVNVDFAYLKDATADLVTHHGPLSQSMFLHRMGLQARLDALTTSAKTDERKKQIEQAAKRLVDPTGMGTQYQIMGMTGKRKGVLADEERWPFVDPEAEQDRAQAGVEKPSASQS